MQTPRDLILFDVDGTLVDSQAHIVGSMDAVFSVLGLQPPSRDAILSIVGLSLPQAFAVLCPDLPESVQQQLVEGYKNSFADLRTKMRDASPLYAGAKDCLDILHANPDYVLGVATGKSKRGMDYVMQSHNLQAYFETVQVADFHPSKPHPAMAQTAMDDVNAHRGVMIGDTVYDMQMGRAAGLKTIAVTWGYHSAEDLAPYADALVQGFDAMPDVITNIWGLT